MVVFSVLHKPLLSQKDSSYRNDQFKKAEVRTVSSITVHLEKLHVRKQQFTKTSTNVFEAGSRVVVFTTFLRMTSEEFVEIPSTFIRLNVRKRRDIIRNLASVVVVNIGEITLDV